MHNEESILSIDEYGTKRWRNKDGVLHRIGGPAVHYSSGTKRWLQDGELHRIDGPAIEWANGRKAFYLGGKYFKTKEAFFEVLTDKEKKIALFSEAFLNA
jgi:hypothetical protein